MQGIQLFHYKYLLNNLQKLQQDKTVEIPAEHIELIRQQEQKLNEIYNNYQLAINQVSLLIKQFEEHKMSIRRVVSHHKAYQKTLNRKNSFTDKFQLP